jgi:hypothetical protein
VCKQELALGLTSTGSTTFSQLLIGLLRHPLCRPKAGLHRAHAEHSRPRTSDCRSNDAAVFCPLNSSCGTKCGHTGFPRVRECSLRQHFAHPHVAQLSSSMIARSAARDFPCHLLTEAVSTCWRPAVQLHRDATCRYLLRNLDATLCATQVPGRGANDSRSSHKALLHCCGDTSCCISRPVILEVLGLPLWSQLPSPAAGVCAVPTGD